MPSKAEIPTFAWAAQERLWLPDVVSRVVSIHKFYFTSPGGSTRDHAK